MTSVIIARFFVDKDPQNTVHSFKDVFGLIGIRDSKKVGDVTYSYLPLDGMVVRQTWTDDEGDHTFDIIYFWRNTVISSWRFQGGLNWRHKKTS